MWQHLQLPHHLLEGLRPTGLEGEAEPSLGQSQGSAFLNSMGHTSVSAKERPQGAEGPTGLLGSGFHLSS